MRIAYLDCLSGISGDMTLGALVDAGADLATINAGVQSLGLPGVRVLTRETRKRGYRAVQIVIEHEPEHRHRHLHHVTAMIDGASISARQKELARKIFTRLAEAEAWVHGTSVEKVHFHEVGAVDSIVDIVGSAIGWDLLGVERIECSPIPAGTGTIEIAHGKTSVPAPATARLLQGIPLAQSDIPHELTTPTGAAIVAVLADAFGPLPAMTIQRIGCGAGRRDLDQQPNLLRLIVGEASAETSRESATLLETNLDDASGELIGYAIDRLWKAGALDVFTAAIQMKKNRPGVMLSALCQACDADRMEEILLRETTTLGVRRTTVQRRVLPRETVEVQTPWGVVAGVAAKLAGAATRFSPEFESCRRVAEEHAVPLQAVYQAAAESWKKQSTGDKRG